MSDFDLMSGFDKGSGSLGDTAPLTTSTTTQPPSEGSNRDSLNLDDFEKVDADQLIGGINNTSSSVSSGIGNVAESTQAAAVGLVDDIMTQVKNSGEDLFSNFAPTGLSSASVETKTESVAPVDPFKMDADIGKEPTNVSSGPSDLLFSSDSILSSDDKTGVSSSGGIDIGFTGISPATDPFTSDLLASAPPPPTSSTHVFDDLSPKSNEKPVSSMGGFDDFLVEKKDDLKESVKEVTDPLFDSFSSFGSNPQPVVTTDFVESAKRDPSPDFRNPTPPRTPTAPDDILASPKQPTPPRTPTPPPREPTPPPREPTPPPKEPTPPPKEPTPPPKQPTPPRTPTPPRREPTPPPREPTPPPREPTPPPKKPSPPPREPTPPPREPTPPPREPTPPPREPTPPPKEPTPPPPKKITPPPVVVETLVSPPVQEAKVSSPGKNYTVSSSTKKAFNVFKPRAWFNPDQLDPRVVELIYWRDVKKTGVVFGSLMVILLSLAYLSLISVVAYTSLAILTGTITFRVYKNIMQAVQKSNDGHPFKNILEMDTNLPSDKVHEATDVIVSQINSSVTELKRLFLVEDLVDSVKFGCLLWCLTYLGSWFNGLTLVILAVVALFSLPKVYEQNQTQIDQYVGLVRSQVNDVMSKVKAALPIGNKEKTQ